MLKAQYKTCELKEKGLLPMQLPLFKEESRLILCSQTYYSSFESVVEKETIHVFKIIWEKQAMHLRVF